MCSIAPMKSHTKFIGIGMSDKIQTFIDPILQAIARHKQTTHIHKFIAHCAAIFQYSFFFGLLSNAHEYFADPYETHLILDFEFFFSYCSDLGKKFCYFSFVLYWKIVWCSVITILQQESIVATKLFVVLAVKYDKCIAN